LSALTLRAATDKTLPRGEPIEIAPRPPQRAATRVTTLGEQLFDQAQDTHTFEKKHPAAIVLAAAARRPPDREWRQRDSSGISKASQTASHTVFGSFPAARAWFTVAPPSLAST
jgi:hypothetical protein